MATNRASLEHERDREDEEALLLLLLLTSNGAVEDPMISMNEN